MHPPWQQIFGSDDGGSVAEMAKVFEIAMVNDQVMAQAWAATLHRLDQHFRARKVGQVAGCDQCEIQNRFLLSDRGTRPGRWW